MIKLLQYFEEDKCFNLTDLDKFSYILHKPAMGKNRVHVFLSKSLLVFILKGKKIVHAKSGDIIINAGEAFFARKGTFLISEKMSEENEFQSLLFFIDDSFLKSFTDKYVHLLAGTDGSRDDGAEIFKIQASRMLKASAESLIPYFSSDISHKKELLQLKFEELLFHLLDTDKDRKFIRFFNSIRLETKIDIIHYMEKNFILPLSVEEFARQTGRSLSSFKKEFKTIYNQPPKQWINEQRLERAHLLLINSDKNITEVSLDVGYENLSHFIQLFRKKYGLTPGEVRKGSAKIPEFKDSVDISESRDGYEDGDYNNSYH